MSRVRQTDPIVLVLNLGLFLGASLLPWPTALLLEALGEDNRPDRIAAVVVFAIVSRIHGVWWLALDVHLARHPELLESTADVA
jgi:hypothetical protein